MKINELIDNFDINKSNEESKLLDKIKHPIKISLLSDTLIIALTRKADSHFVRRSYVMVLTSMFSIDRPTVPDLPESRQNA